MKGKSVRISTKSIEGHGRPIHLRKLTLREAGDPRMAGSALLLSSSEVDYAAASARYQVLLKKKRLAQATSSDLDELENIARIIASKPPPPEFVAAMMSLANDRKALRESIEKIEHLLNLSTHAQRRADTLNAKSTKIQRLSEVQTLPSS